MIPPLRLLTLAGGLARSQAQGSTARREDDCLCMHSATVTSYVAGTLHAGAMLGWSRRRIAQPGDERRHCPPRGRPPGAEESPHRAIAMAPEHLWRQAALAR